TPTLAVLLDHPRPKPCLHHGPPRPSASSGLGFALALIVSPVVLRVPGRSFRSPLPDLPPAEKDASHLALPQPHGTHPRCTRPLSALEALQSRNPPVGGIRPKRQRTRAPGRSRRQSSFAPFLARCFFL